MPRNNRQNLGVANLDNSTPYESAGDNLKCMYFAFGKAEGIGKDDVYRFNEKLLESHEILDQDRAVTWDDTAFGVELAHRYGYKLHPTILLLSQVPERFKTPNMKLIVFYRLGGDQVPEMPAEIRGNAEASKHFVRALLTDAAYERIEFHAICGEINRQGAITFYDNGQVMRNLPRPDPRCVVFSKGA